MATTAMLPREFQKTMQQLLDADFPHFVEAMNLEVPVSIHRNPYKSLSSTLGDTAVPWYRNGFYLDQRPVFTLDPAFHAGAYYVQEASSMFVAEVIRQLADFHKPLKVLDACAAPGGKSTLLASILDPTSLLISNEVIKSRYPVLRYNMYKWGRSNTATSHHGLADFAPLAGFFDLVLVDAPCSGEGMFRKDPAAIGEWSAEHVDFCSLRQQRILKDAHQLVRPGGLLIYSTCTYNQKENQNNVAWLLKEGGFNLAALSLAPDWGVQDTGLGYQFYPHRLQGEGFFLAVMEKIEGGDTKFNKAKEFSRLDRVSKKEANLADPYLEEATQYRFYRNKKGMWRAFRKEQLEDWQLIAGFLPRLEAGIPIGEPKGKDLVPAPELALYSGLSSLIPQIALDKTTALRYLKKEAININSQAPKGRLLATYQGLGLGWLKNLSNRVNNNYPKHWRIRMDI